MGNDGIGDLIGVTTLMWTLLGVDLNSTTLSRSMEVKPEHGLSMKRAIRCSSEGEEKVDWPVSILSCFLFLFIIDIRPDYIFYSLFECYELSFLSVVPFLGGQACLSYAFDRC